jgi:hypothetical protein
MQHYELRKHKKVTIATAKDLMGDVSILEQ